MNTTINAKHAEIAESCFAFLLCGLSGLCVDRCREVST
jgi:hypothetical protein